MYFAGPGNCYLMKQVQISYICIILQALKTYIRANYVTYRVPVGANAIVYAFLLIFLFGLLPGQAKSSANDNVDSALAWEAEGNSLFFSRHFDEAAALFSDAYMSTSELDNVLIPAGYAFKAGTSFYQAGLFEEALRYLQKAEAVLEQVPGPDYTALVMLYTNMGAANIKMARFSLAISYYQQAEALLLATRGRHHPFMGSIYLNMGVIFHYGGDYENCRLYYDRSLQLFRENESAYRASISRVLHNLGMLAYDRGDYDRALAYFRESKEYSTSDNASTLTSTYNNMARSLNKMGAYDEAERYYLKAIVLTRDTFGSNHPELGLFALNYASFLSRLNRHDDALEVITEIAPAFEERYDSWHPHQARYREVMADIWLRMGDAEKAMHYAEKAADILNDYQRDIGGMAEKTGYNPAVRNFVLTNKKQQAFILKQMADLAGCADDHLQYKKRKYDLLSEAVNVVGDLHVDYSSKHSSMTLTGDEKETFVSAADAAYVLHKLTGDRKYLHKAFEISGLARGAVLTQVIKGFEGFRVADVPVSYQKEEASLQRKLHMLDALIAEESERVSPNSERIAYWNDQLFDANMRYQELTNILERDYPEYYQLKYKAGVMDVSAIQAQLQDGQVLAEYLMGDGVLLIFVISDTSFHVYRQTLDASFFAHQENVHAAFHLDHAFFGGKPEYLSFTGSSHALYQILLESVMEDFDPSSLVIVPDETLSLLPYEVLLTSPAREDMPDYAGLPYLIKKIPVSYTYSSALMFGEQDQGGRRETDAPLEALVMAPVYGDKDLAPGIALHDHDFTPRDMLMPLPGAGKEAAFVKDHFGGNLLAGEEATKQAFFDYAEVADILHLSMHAIVDTVHPMHSRLVFQSTNRDAGFENLYAYEIYGMQMPASLAVLSACNTGAGKVVSGEGIMSFTRSFLYAGVRNILMTLWAVPDLASTTLVKGFYAELSEETPKHVALQRAKLDFLEDALPSKAHPYFWAGYVTIGDISPLQPAPKDQGKSAAGILVWVVHGVIILLLGIRGIQVLT